MPLENIFDILEICCTFWNSIKICSCWCTIKIVQDVHHWIFSVGDAERRTFRCGLPQRLFEREKWYSRLDIRYLLTHVHAQESWETLKAIGCKVSRCNERIKNPLRGFLFFLFFYFFIRKFAFLFALFEISTSLLYEFEILLRSKESGRLMKLMYSRLTSLRWQLFRRRNMRKKVLESLGRESKKRKRFPKVFVTKPEELSQGVAIPAIKSLKRKILLRVAN